MRIECPLALGLLLALAGCAAVPPPPPAAATVPMRALPLPQQPAPERPAAAPLAPSAAAAPRPATMGAYAGEAVIDHADRIRALSPAELGLEIQRLGESPYEPARALQLAQALGQSRNAVNAVRAQALLQRVLAQQDAEAVPLHPLARLLSAQLAEQRRNDEQAERQAQQLRDAQRRIDQLNERLEAVRAIERSLPSRPRGTTPAPGPQ